MNFDANGLARLGLAVGPALLIRVTLVLAAGAALAALPRRTSAAARHFVWLLTLVGVLGVTALAAWPRGVRVAIPRWPRWAAAVGAPTAAWETREALPDAPVPALAGASHGAGARRALEGHVPAVRPSARESLDEWLLLPWLGGTCLVLAWLALGRMGLARIARRAQPVDDPGWRLLLERTAREAGVGGAVRLRQSHEVGAPVVYGLRRPTILLPADAGSWDAERRRVVLLHELAHIARRDPLSQSIAWLACAIYWLHPLVWKAAARLRSESERACDDRVLASRVAAPDYAAHLLGLARRARALRFAGAVSVAMARRSNLEGRLLSLLDEGACRTVLTPRVRGAGIAVLTFVLVGVGLMRPTPPAAAVTPRGPSASKPAAAPASDPSTPAASDPSTPDPSAEKTAASVTEEPEPGAEAFNAEQPAEPGEMLELDLESGAKLTIQGWDERRVEVRGFLAGRDAHWQSAGLEREGNRHVLRIAPKRHTGSFSTSNRFTIRVPRRFDIKFASAGGKVTIRDVEGAFEGWCGGGGFAIERAKGRASLSTGGGEIRVTDCELSGTVSTGGGMVMLSRVRGGLRGKSGSGPVIYSDSPEGQLVEPGNLEGLASLESLGTLSKLADLSKLAKLGDLSDLTLDESGVITIGSSEDKHAGKGPEGILHVEKAGGAIRMADAPNGVRATTGGGDITIGRAGGIVDAGTGGGDIEIGPASGSVRAGTGAGDVHVILARGEARRTVDLTSGHGGVVIEVPRGMDVDLDLETAYTRSSHPAQIRSDLPVRIETTTGWDDREGTPRRYVRARSTAGHGALVRVKTVNGDIEIRTIGSL